MEEIFNSSGSNKKNLSIVEIPILDFPGIDEIKKDLICAYNKIFSSQGIDIQMSASSYLDEFFLKVIVDKKKRKIYNFQNNTKREAYTVYIEGFFQERKYGKTAREWRDVYIEGFFQERKYRIGELEINAQNGELIKLSGNFSQEQIGALQTLLKSQNLELEEKEESNPEVAQALETHTLEIEFILKELAPLAVSRIIKDIKQKLKTLKIELKNRRQLEIVLGEDIIWGSTNEYDGAGIGIEGYETKYRVDLYRWSIYKLLIDGQQVYPNDRERTNNKNDDKATATNICEYKLPASLIFSNFEDGKVEMKVNEESGEIKIFDKGRNGEIVLLWSGTFDIRNYDLRGNNQGKFFLDDSRKKAIIEILKQNNI